MFKIHPLLLAVSLLTTQAACLLANKGDVEAEDNFGALLNGAATDMSTLPDMRADMATDMRADMRADMTSADLCEGVDCNGHGTCEVEDGEAKCDCDEGYDGESACTLCDEGYTLNGAGECLANCVDAACGPNKVCAAPGEPSECVCAPGYAGETCGFCDRAAGYFPAPDNMSECLPPRRSCEELEMAGGLAGPGFYTMAFEGDRNRPWKAYCASPKDSPQIATYIPLIHTSTANTFTYTEQDAGTGLVVPTVQTSYRMVRFLAADNIIDATDDTFAKTVYFNLPDETAQGSGHAFFGTMVTRRETGLAPPPNTASLPPFTSAKLSLDGTSLRITSPFAAINDNESKPCASGGHEITEPTNQARGFTFSSREEAIIGPMPSTFQHFGDRCAEKLQGPAGNTAQKILIKVTYDAPQPEDLIKAYPKSCFEVKRTTPNPMNTEYFLFVDNNQNRPWRAQCEAMDTPEPQSYLILPETASSLDFIDFYNSQDNVFSYFYQPPDPEPLRASKIAYERVQLDPYTLEINTTNKQYTTLKHSNPSAPGLATRQEMPAFGTIYARGMINFPENSGAPGKIDTGGTPFKLAPDNLGYPKLFAAGECNTDLAVMFDGMSQHDIYLTAGPSSRRRVAPVRGAYFNRADIVFGETSCPDRLPPNSWMSPNGHVMRLEYR